LLPRKPRAVDKVHSSHREKISEIDSTRAQVGTLRGRSEASARKIGAETIGDSAAKATKGKGSATFRAPATNNESNTITGIKEDADKRSKK
jgi:hypothetical protein